MKPGDLIEWVYTDDGSPAVPREELWSSIEKRWVLVGGAHLLIALADGILTWLPLHASHKGLLHAREDDTMSNDNGRASGAVAPRALG